MRNPFRRTRGRHRSGTVTVDDLILRRCADKPDPSKRSASRSPSPS